MLWGQREPAMRSAGTQTGVRRLTSPTTRRFQAQKRKALAGTKSVGLNYSSVPHSPKFYISVGARFQAFYFSQIQISIEFLLDFVFTYMFGNFLASCNYGNQAPSAIAIYHWHTHTQHKPKLFPSPFSISLHFMRRSTEEVRLSFFVGGPRWWREADSYL